MPAAYADNHGKGSISPEVLEKFKPEPIDPALADKLATLFKLRSPGVGIPSNDGTQITCSWALGQVAQIYEFTLNPGSSTSVQITNESQPVTLVGLTPDEKYTVTMIDEDGTEKPGIYLIDRRTNTKTKVFHEPRTISAVLHISQDSRYIYFQANNHTDKTLFTLYRYEIATGKTETFFTMKNYWGISDFLEDSGRMIIASHRTNTVSDNFLYDLSTHDLVPLLGQGEEQDYSLLFANKPGSYLVRTSKFADFTRLYLWNGRDSKNESNFNLISPDQALQIEGASYSADRTKLFVSVNDQGYSRILGYDGKTLSQIGLPTFEKADQTIAGDISGNGRFQTFGVVTFDKPGLRYLYDWQTGKKTLWYQPHLDGVSMTQTTPDTLEYYPAEDGTPIPMFVRRPADYREKNYPVLVHFHGGPEGQSVPGFSVMIQAIVDAGFIVAQPNVRDSEGYGRKWLDADNRGRRLDVISDIRAASTFIRNHWTHKGQAPKIGIFGGSYGGYATLIGMTMFAGSYDAGVSIVGMSNLVTFLQNTDDARRYLREPEYGYLRSDLEILRKLSPMTYLDNLSAPLMIIQGASDPRVPVSEAVQMHDALAAKDINSPLIIFADEGHGSAKTANKILEVGHLIAFFQKHLKQP